MKKKMENDLHTIQDSIKALDFMIKTYNDEGTKFSIVLGKKEDKDVLYVNLESDIDIVIQSIDGYEIIKRIVK